MSKTLLFFVKRFFIILLGYGAAIVTAAVTTLSLISLFGQNLTFGFVNLLTFAVLYTAITSVLPATVFIAVCEKFGRPSFLIHAVAGGLSALTAHGIFYSFLDSSMRVMNSGIIMASIGGGIIGAMAYWRIAVAPYEKTVPPIEAF